MPRSALKLALTAAALSLTGACASVPSQPTPPRAPGQGEPSLAQQARGAQPARARYLPYAGAPIDHFNWMGYIEGWEALSDSELVVFVGASGAYMLTVWSPCGTRGLPWVNHIELTRSIAGSVYARFDSVRVDRMSCPIAEIRPIDLRRMRAAARAASAAPAAETPPPPPK
ncbi:MAG TPA: DUF6491 family protein [Steroidobacteraceae bacterium]|nr:DUF6491 family protein [Steroidobacteraceae bacterium]